MPNFTIPADAVKLNRPPLRKNGWQCNPSGDRDQCGRHVAHANGEWYAWYQNPNEPLFPADPYPHEYVVISKNMLAWILGELPADNTLGDVIEARRLLAGEGLNDLAANRAVADRCTVNYQQVDDRVRINDTVTVKQLLELAFVIANGVKSNR